jgi:hypothetical protein
MTVSTYLDGAGRENFIFSGEIGNPVSYDLMPKTKIEAIVPDYKVEGRDSSGGSGT